MFCYSFLLEKEEKVELYSIIETNFGNNHHNSLIRRISYNMQKKKPTL